jgi:hypothetical protein
MKGLSLISIIVGILGTVVFTHAGDVESRADKVSSSRNFKRFITPEERLEFYRNNKQHIVADQVLLVSYVALFLCWRKDPAPPDAARSMLAFF